MAIAGSLIYSTEIDKSGFEKGLNSMKNISGVISNAIKVALGAISTAVTAIGTYAIKVGSDFEAGMSKVQAISGATGEEIEKLTEKAKEMGQKTKFSATESAEAFQYMAMAGWKTEDMLDGIEGIMNLAAASGEDLASVSDIVTDALTAFGLQAKDSGHFADVLAKASSNSNTNVGLMGETFKYVAPLAGSMKYSIEDTAVAIGLMANAGIKGSQSGTALRSILTRLVKPPEDAAQALTALKISAKNSDGTMKPLSQTLQELRKKFSKLSDSQKLSYAASIAGQEAMSGMLAIVNASDSDFEKLTASINNADGASKEMADTMNDNVKGAFTLLKSNVESVGIKLYDKIKEPLKKLINTISKYVSQIPTLLKNVYNWVNKNKEALKVLVKVIASVSAGFLAYKAVLVAITVIQTAKNILGTVSAFLSLIPTIRSAKDAMLLLNMTFSANPIGLVVAAVAALTTAFILLTSKQRESEKANKEFAKEMKKSKDAYEEYNQSVDKTTESNLAQINSASRLKDELKTLVDENGNVKKGYEGRVDFILTQLNEALGTEYTRTGEVIEKYRELQGEIDNLVEKKKAEIILEGKKQKWEKANEEEETATKDLTEAYNNLGMSIEEAKEKRKTLREELYAIQREANPIKELFNSYRYGELDNLENLISAYENSEARVKQCTENKKDYENNYILWQEGKYSEIGNTIKDTTSNWANASLKTIKDTISQEKENLEISKILYEKTGNDIYLQQQKQSKLNLENLANELVAKTQTLTELGEEEKQAWKTLGEDSYENYSVAMSQMSPDMQQKIQDATGIIAAGTPEMQAKADELGRKTVEAFDKSADAKQKGLSTITSYLKGISDDEKREFLKQAGIENADAVIDELNKGNLSEDSGRNILEGLWKGLKNGTWQGKILGVASGLAQSVNKAFTGKDGWDKHSPSKKMKKFAENYVQPISDVMKKRKKGITDTAKDLANSVNKSFEIQKINDEIYRKMQNAVARENASITARASIKANNSMLNVIQANFSIDGSVDIDGQKAGRILAPNVSKTLRMAGV